MTLTLPIVAIVLVILFLSTITRASLGFGDALVGMPLLTLVIGVQQATPLIGLISFTIACIILTQAWRDVDIRGAWRLILSSFAGIPIGLFLLTSIPEAIVTTLLGLILILYGAYSLFKPKLEKVKDSNENLAFGFGFVAGILGGAYNASGPPIVIYGTRRGWTPERFRATMQSYFLFTHFIIIISHGVSGLWNPTVIVLFLLSIPIMILSAMLGKVLINRISHDRFSRIVYTFLIIIGLFMIVNTL